MIKEIKLTKSDEENLFINIKNEIILKLQNIRYTGHIDDLGNEIGMAVSNHIYKNNKSLNIFGFDKKSFIYGFEHGASLNDGTH
jgi:hypothetical protein